MRHVIVTRVTFVVFALFLAAAGLFAWIAAPRHAGAPAQPPPASGRALYEQHCSSCHDEATLRAGTRARDAAGRDDLVRFLVDHGTATTADDRRIVEFLAEIPRSSP